MATEEKFDVFDESGYPTGATATKQKVHQDGLWHTGVHLLVTDGNGNIFQQLRGNPPYVRILPGVWDIFIAAGHVSAGESPYASLLREADEEVGPELSTDRLHAGQLTQVGKTRSNYWVEDPAFPAGGYWHRVHDHNFVAVVPNLDPRELTLEENKVLAVRKYPIEQLLDDLQQPTTSHAYSQHAHRPPDDKVLYEKVLAHAQMLST